MKKLLFLMILLLTLVFVFVGCAVRDTDSSDDSESTTEATTTKLSDSEQTALIDEFNQLLEDGINEDAALEKIRTSIADLSKENASAMVLAFEEYQIQNLEEDTVLTQGMLNSLSQSGIYNEDELNDPEQIEETELKSVVETLQAKGYRLRSGEGQFWAIIDYSVYLEFVDYTSEDIAAYIDFMTEESMQSAVGDAALLIPIEEIYSRARLAEDFITDYPESAKYDFMSNKYLDYTYLYFYGADNTPAFNSDTHILGNDFKSSYQNAKDDEQISTLADKTADYLVILETNSYTLTDNVIQYRNAIIDTLTE